MVEPLRRRTMTLEQLQKKTLQLIKRVHKHLNTPTHISGVTDAEFLEKACYGLETRITEDIEILQGIAMGNLCEHGAIDGDYCPQCNQDYKLAAIENETSAATTERTGGTE